jgi:hypothetical protein
MTGSESESKRFAPKVPVQLDPPKDDPISQEELAKCDGNSTSAHSLETHQTDSHTQVPTLAVRLSSLSKALSLM